ncbi:MAG: glycerophosphodiester phosphodiesterase [Polyangiaceae bacterium]|nr:glycerophosphodiester phosphodiesterase [Polyangiaceae bacterium]MCL4755338.1 glycerophosphodiester phosphodiesterase [Myxococcales bacterium]
MSPRREPPALRHFRRHAGAPPWVLGHRGARREAPENTLPAFQLAVEQGAAGVELDVRLDGDGRVIVLHDRTLERVTSGADSRDVEQLSGRELDAVSLAGGARVPALSEVLDWAVSGGHLLNVELKRDVSERRALVWRVAKLLRAHPAARERVLLSSFDPLFVRALAWLVPEVPSAWLVHAKQRVLSAAPGYRRLGAVGVHPELAIAADARVRRWHAQGALVNVWTVNEPAEARRLAAAGVDALISDVPGAIAKALD